MKIPVVNDFRDRIDKKVYREGKPFPSSEIKYTLTKERLAELLSNRNKQEKPLIAVNKSMLADELKEVADFLELDYDSKTTKDELIKLIEGV